MTVVHEPHRSWLVRGRLAAHRDGSLHGFSDRCRDAASRLSRSTVLVDTLHPIHEARVSLARRQRRAAPVVEYGPSNVGEAAASCRAARFYDLVTSGANELRRPDRRRRPAGLRDPTRDESGGARRTTSLSPSLRPTSIIGEMDCVYSSWATIEPDGFREADLVALRRLVPLLALAIKCVSLARIARTLVEVYLGHDAGERVLSGRISRGVAERINSVIWYSICAVTEDPDTGARRDHSAAQRLRGSRNRRRSHRRGKC